MIYRLLLIPALLIVSLGLILADDPEKLIWSESFDQSSAQWRTSNNADELFLFEQGQYVLWRKNTTSPSVILPEQGDLFGDCRASITVSLDAILGGSAGMSFLAKQDGSLAYIAEISSDKQFRVRKLDGGSFTELSGKPKSSGWVKEKSIKDAGEPNTLELSYKPGALVLSINQKQVWVGNEMVQHKGKCGVYIGPESRARLDDLKVFVSDTEAERIKNDRNNNDPARSALTDIIIQLRKTINAQNREIDSLQDVSGKLKAESDRLDRSPKNVKKLSAEVYSLKKELASSQAKLKKAEKELLSLRKFKDNIRKNQSGDIVISLTTALAEEKDKNAELAKENKELKAKLAAMEAEQNK
ncbi:MAG: hypothetical protein EP332_06205 [Bacteroidetes bacterium]|nr:MAG: hypothetical protein EP332_06205 [Bacteroidota bacterium]